MLQPNRRSIARAQAMRKALTPAEARLWTALRRRALGGLRFRRQHPVGPYILDFDCETAKLAVEADGVRHDYDDDPIDTRTRSQTPFVAFGDISPVRGKRRRSRKERSMIGYVTLGANDVEAALPFYDGVLGAIGYARKSFDGRWAFYGPADGEGNVGICKPFDGEAARGGNGVMVAFAAPSHDAVKAAHAAALAAGGTDEGAPGYRPPDGTSFYGAYVRDAAGNKLCLFHPG